jgi:acetoin utilization protein AcuB
MLAVNDLMTVNPKTITPETTLQEVLSLMNTEGYRHLPVVEDGQLVGIITDRDVRLAVNSPILTADLSKRRELISSLHAESCMTRDLITVKPTTSVARAAEMLSLYKIGALPVLDKGMLVGIITVTDCLDYLATMDAAIMA